MVTLKKRDGVLRGYSTLLPSDPLGRRYVDYFWFPFCSIYADEKGGGESPAWFTSKYYLEAADLWRNYLDEKKLVGVRFGKVTKFSGIDIDAGGMYHNLESINGIKQALETIGIVNVVTIWSSYSRGYHLIITFEKELQTFDLACAIELCLRDAGFVVSAGNLEIFPNPKLYSESKHVNYNAIRAPMQVNGGALLLSDDLAPISDDVKVFLDYCDHAASRQDLVTLKRACKKASVRLKKERRRQRETSNVREWRLSWENTISNGWTDFGQTNGILRVLVGYAIVFLGLNGEQVVEYAVNTAINAPGYTQFCRHQHEIEARVRDWLDCMTGHEYYSRYCSYPERLLKTFGATFKDAFAGGANNVVAFDRRELVWEEQRQIAQRQIKFAVATIEWESGLQEGATLRGKEICAVYKRLFNKSLSLETLHKYKFLWHPNFYVENPWTTECVNGCNAYGADYYGHSTKNISDLSFSNRQNPDETVDYGHFDYMKVCMTLCLPPASTPPQEVAEQVEATNFEAAEERVLEDVEETESENDPVVEVVVQESKCTNYSNDSSNSNKEHVSVPCPEELRNEIMSRLKANSYARSEVQRYCALTGVFLCGDQRKHFLERAKYQFYLDSKCETLVNEAIVWAGANPGCLPFKVGKICNGCSTDVTDGLF